MGILQSGNSLHWNYFLALDQDLAKVARYIEFCEANLDTFSIELAHLLLAASSEVDVVLKGICNHVSPAKNHETIRDYKETICAHVHGLVEERVHIPRYGLLDLQPFFNWENTERNPDWWRAHNAVKHDRANSFQEANLKNTINALSALCLSILFFHSITEHGEVGQAAFRRFVKPIADDDTLIKFDSSYYPSALLLEG